MHYNNISIAVFKESAKVIFKGFSTSDKLEKLLTYGMRKRAPVLSGTEIKSQKSAVKMVSLNYQLFNFKLSIKAFVWYKMILDYYLIKVNFFVA